MEEVEPKETPMGKVWLIVLGTVVFVIGAAFLWHHTQLSTLVAGDMAEEQKIADNIERLSQYRDGLRASSTPASQIQSQK